jgi:hypothetical protein
VVDLVKSRIDKARSVKNKANIKEGVDIELLSETILGKLGNETYRKFYKEKILNQKALKNVELFSSPKEPYIESTLFGWDIFC